MNGDLAIALDFRLTALARLIEDQQALGTNRLNVAVSRAQCLAILVRGTNLLELAPGSVADLVRLDGFARADALGSSP